MYSSKLANLALVLTTLLVVLCPNSIFGKLTLTLREDGENIANLALEFSSTSVRNITLSPGLTYIIECTLDNIGSFLDNPWTKDSEELIERNDAMGNNPLAYYQNTHATVRILYLHEFDSSLIGKYSCVSTDDSKTLNIYANNPAIVLSIDYFGLKKGTSESLNVGSKAFGDPVPVITSMMHTWFFQGNETSSGLSISQFGSLFIFFSAQGFVTTYSGEYTITINTTAGTSSASFVLDVFAIPSIEFGSNCDNCLDNDQLSIVIGNNFSLSCTDTNSFPVPKLTWFRGGGTSDPDDLLIPNDRLTIETVSPRESKLVFTDIDLSYVDEYSCKANNSLQKDVKSVNVIVQYPPKVNSISLSSIDVPVSRDLVILVDYVGGEPAPSATWTYLNGTTPLSENKRFMTSGDYNLNLTITDCEVEDGGVYRLTVDNGVLDSVTLEYTVNIQVPPTLIRYSNLTTYRPVGGSASFIVGVVDARPPITPDDLIWSGNFDSSKMSSEYVEDEAVMELSDLTLGDGGDITLTARHPGGDVDMTFELIVLNVPAIPGDIQITSVGTCHFQLTWVISDPAPSTAPTDEVLLEQRACLYNDMSCDKEWEVLTMHSFDEQHCNVSVLPNEDYSFRVTSCNNLVGCSDPEVIQQGVNSRVQDFSPVVSSLNVRSINSSSIQVLWAEPEHKTDCYEVSNYRIECSDETENVVSDVRLPERMSRNHTLDITDLEPDTQYTCVVSVTYNDLFGGVASINATPRSDNIYTSPSIPDIALEIMIETGDGEGEMTLELSNLRSSADSISYIHVIVLRLTSLTLPDESPDDMYPSINDFTTYDAVHSQGSRVSYRPYIAAEIPSNNIPDTFTVGSGRGGARRRSNEYFNGPLVPDNYYTIFVRVYARASSGRQYESFLSSSFATPFQPTGSEDEVTSTSGSGSGGIVAAVVVLVILIVVISVLISLLVIFYFYKRRGKHQSSIASNTNGEIPLNDYTYLEDVKILRQSLPRETPPSLPATDPPKKKPISATNPGLEPEPSKEEEEGTKKRRVSTHSSRSHTPKHPVSPTPSKGKTTPSLPVERADFQEHLNHLDDNNQQLFEKEFLHLQVHSEEYPAEASCRAHMHGKNRYKNITAFDYTRVVLKEVEGLPNSDYINANYVKGYDDHKLYIATQGPNEETHVDFWRMIWERKTTTIVMLTNLEEKGKPKCFKYWPNQGGKAYGNIVVRVDRDIVLPFYTIRSFKLIDASYSEGERTVIQFHYTAWPDKNVPAQASPLLDFLRAINTANDSRKHGPVVVHCSAGVGRSGTIIALDICLDQLKTEGRVDVRGIVSFLRKQRTQMVQTQSQYIFIHHAILEDIVYGDSTVLLKNYFQKYLKLQASHCALIKGEYEKIGTVRPPAQASSGPNIIKIRAEDEGEDSSFPAYVVDGYWYPNLFLACSYPSLSDQELFWHLVWQEGCTHIINISQKTHGLFVYLPDSGEQLKVGDLEITVDRMEYKTGYILRYITIATEQCKETLSVKHMQYEGWMPKQLPRAENFVKFLLECVRETHSSEREGHPILVHGSGNMSQVGIFIALLNCCERIKKERLVDLLQAINRLHLQCPESISSLELNQYAYCYDSLHEYCGKLSRENSEPPIYENIASIRGRLQPSPEPVQEVPTYLKDYDILDASILLNNNSD